MRELQSTDSINYWIESFNDLAAKGLSGSFANDADLNSGLDFFVREGHVRHSSTGQIETIGDTTVTLPNDSISIVYVDRTAGAEKITSSIEGSHPADPNVTYLYRVTTSGGAITTIEDWRTWLNILTNLEHNLLVERDLPGLHNRYEYEQVMGNIANPMLNLPLKSPNDAINLKGDFQFLRESDATYIDRYGVLQKTLYYTGTPTSSDAFSINDTGASFGSLEGYVIYLTDGTNEAYRLVDAWHTTKAIWSKPIAFNPTTYKLSKPRFENKGLLIEGVITNLYTYSEDFTTNWAPSVNGQIIADTITAPDGTLTADTYEVTAAAIPWLTQGTKDFVAGTPYTASIFVKKRDISDVTILYYGSVFNSGGADLSTRFDLDTGTIISQDHARAGIERIGNNGWYRIWASHEATATSTDSGIQLVRLVSSTIGQGNYIWGAQLEELEFASSYIPTDDANVTRSKDDLNIDAKSNLPSADSDFTVLIDAGMVGNNTKIAQRAWHVGGTDGPLLQEHSTGWGAWDADSNQVVGTTDNTVQSRVGVVFTDNKSIYINGVLSASNAYVKPTGTPTGIGVGHSYNLNNHLFGHLKNFRIYDRALSDEEMRLA